MGEGTSNNIKVKVITALIVIVLTAVIGVSFAYFSISVEGNEEASSLKAITADLKLTFTDGPGINISDVYPGWSTTKTFNIKNDGTDVAYYDIKMYDVYTTFINDELVYTLTSTNGGGSKTETILPNNDGLIKAKISIPAGVTQTFTMTIRFKELNTPQDINQGSIYRGIIQIISPYIYTNGTTAQDITLKQRILLDNTEAYPDNVRSKYVTGSSGISYSNTSDTGYYNDYYIYTENVNFTSSSSSKKAQGTTMSANTNTGLFTVAGTKVSEAYSESSIGKYSCNTTAYTCTTGTTDVYKILEVNGTTVTKVERYVAKPNKSSWNGLGLYQTSTNTEGNLPSYFFRGHVVNNYVKFAGETWRIVRINEDGSIRLLRSSNYTASKYHTVRTNKMYVGFMFGDESNPYSNDNDSAIKTSTETYYNEVLSSYSSYLADVGFCNDRTETSTSGSKIYYGPYSRIGVSSKKPKFACSNAENDLFTTASASKGNKALTYPVGLITVDELSYAGALLSTPTKSYIRGSSFWTISPYYWSGSYSYLYYSTATGVISSNYTTASSIYTRPVINLKADTLVLGGSGSSSDPYIVTQ